MSPNENLSPSESGPSPGAAGGRRSSLSRRFSFALIAVVTLVLVAFSTFAILYNVSHNQSLLKRRANLLT
ncbi:MAG: hypothetical protein QF437_19355 [Planctomycetota bacterium]|jgi:hypothetical protein|nr:hypothetical protein [Planctomycetota bacterium]